MDAPELARWTRFAAKGGIGRCTATMDCVAESAEDLMFLKDDEIIVLMQLPNLDNIYLGYCEGVVGRFDGSYVQFNGKLKRPVMTKRSSATAVTGRTSLTRSAESPAPSLQAMSPVPPSPHGSATNYPTAVVPSPHASLVSLPESMETTSLGALARSISHSSIRESLRAQVLVAPEPFRSSTAASDDRISLTPAMTYTSSSSTISTRQEVTPPTPRADLDDLAPVAKVSEGKVESGDEQDASATLRAQGQASESEEGEADLSFKSDQAVEAEEDVININTQRASFASTAPSVYSQRASRLSAQFAAAAAAGELSVHDTTLGGSEPTTARDSRLSGNSDGGYGIGLTLLQSMAGGGDDASSFMSNSSYDDEDEHQRMAEASRTPSPDSTAEGIPYGSMASLHPDEEVGHPVAISPTTSSPLASPVLSVASSSKSAVPPEPVSRSRASTALSHSRSEAASEDWEGSSIYDNYRYSRHSMASKASRYSFASMNDSARPSMDRGYSASSVEQVPPLPADIRVATQNRPAPENLVMDTSSRSPISPAETDSPLSARVRAPPDALDFSRPNRGRPTPLDLNSAVSPLIHATFGSGSPASTSYTDTTRSERSSLSSPPPPLSPRMPQSPSTGVATALRQRLEQERGLANNINMLSFTRVAPESKFAIVIEDDEPLPSGVGDDDKTEEGGLAPARARPRSQSFEESAAAAEQRFSQLSQASQASADSIPTRSVGAQREAVPRIQVEDLHVSHMAFASEPESMSPSSAMSAYPLSALPPLSPATSTAPPSPSSPLASEPPSPGSAPVATGTPTSPYFGNSRTSMFLPHPNAPKRPGPSSPSAGPMYGRKSAVYGDDPVAQQARIPHLGSAIHTMHMARNMAFYPNGAPKQMTIYARCEVDLMASIGPVPVLFTLEPPNAIPANKPPAPPPSMAFVVQPQLQSQPPTSMATLEVPQEQSLAQLNGPSSQQSKGIPRLNFFPQADTTRPRSRSFSGFDKPNPETELPIPKRRGSGDTSTQPAPTPSMQRSSSATVVASGPKKSVPMRSVSARPPVARHSPLALPENNTVVTSPTVHIPSPLSQESRSPPKLGLRQVSSSLQLRGASARSPPTSPLTQRPRRTSDAHRLVTSPTRSTSPHSPEVRASTRMSADTDNSDSRSLMSPPPLLRESNSSSSATHSRENSLRSKLSISLMRPSNGGMSIPPTPTDEREIDVIQVKDMGFELVPPATVGGSMARASMESLRRDPTHGEGKAHLRPSSPTAPSVTSVRPHSPSIHENASVRSLRGPEDSIQVHRQLELKWITLLSAVSPEQMRKSKKVKKLLHDGVPSSVRSVVWANLANIKARRMEGVYAKLGARGKVSASSDIERDLQELFPNETTFQDSSGPVATLLQAYLTMVPDVHYHASLTLIAGYLLQQGPEEDAFWTFASVMDMHLRGYFSRNPLLFEVDAALFSKTLEANDAALAKKLLVQLSLPPPVICKPWFMSIFARALPTEYMVRVWDLFLFDGIPFLFRVGLAIASCCRKQLLEARDGHTALALLSNPPSECLPDNVEAFVTLAYSMKLKDDDIQKQRLKMEAQLRKQNQQSRPARTPGGPTMIVRRT